MPRRHAPRPPSRRRLLTRVIRPDDTVVENEAEKRVEFSETDQRKIIAEKYEESLRKLQEKRSRGD